MAWNITSSLYGLARASAWSRALSKAAAADPAPLMRRGSGGTNDARADRAPSSKDAVSANPKVLSDERACKKPGTA